MTTHKSSNIKPSIEEALAPEKAGDTSVLRACSNCAYCILRSDHRLICILNQKPKSDLVVTPNHVCPGHTPK